MISILFVLLGALAWLSAVACAHDAVFSDPAGGGLARSLLVPCLALLLLFALGLAWSRARSGVPMVWSALLTTFAITAAVGGAAVWLLLSVRQGRPLAVAMQIIAAGAGLWLMLSAWRGTGAPPA